MRTEDKKELEWWRREFSSRFFHDNLPGPGDEYLGARMVLMVEIDDGVLVPWRRGL